MVEDEDGEWVRTVDVPSVEDELLDLIGYETDRDSCKSCVNGDLNDLGIFECAVIPCISIVVDPEIGLCRQFQRCPAPPEVDADGRPWDARIDSPKKVLDADGTWLIREDISVVGLPYYDIIKSSLMNSAEASPEPAVVEGPEVDSTGRPRDKRIDAPSRSLCPDGTWRRKRHVPPKVRGEVLAEYITPAVEND
jgi:hypothetical protein